MAERVSIEEAAKRLGVSQTSIRRRLRAGTLTGERRPTPQGHVWLVDVPDAPHPPPDQSPPSQSPAVDQAALTQMATELAVSKEAVARLEAHVASLETELAARRVEVERLIVVAREGQRALTAPLPEPGQAEPADSQPADEPPTRDQAPPTRPEGAPPWWRRAWAWFNGDQVPA